MKHEELIRKMKLEEKAALLSGKGEWQTWDLKRVGIPSMETNRCTFLLTYSDEQAIREIYLKPFETCVKNFTGGALAVMSSFN